MIDPAQPAPATPAPIEPPDTIRVGKSEVRLDGDGDVDEIVIRDAEGRCLFHLERMSNGLFWSAVYDPTVTNGGRVDVNFHTQRNADILARYEDSR